MSTSAAHAGARLAPSRFVDPRVLARIANLDLIARHAVDGFVSGMHRARHLGVSTDFAEHRPYTPGDDVRRIDWRLFARSDRLNVKTFEAETNTDLVLALDASQSMTYGSGEVSKIEYACMLLASFAHLGARQRDRVGLATFASDLIDVIPPAAGRRDAVIATLERLQPRAGLDLPQALERLGAALLRRSIVVLVSDFYLEVEAALGALSGLQARGHEVLVFRVLDPRERDLALDGAQVLEDLETGERMPVVPERIQAQYRDLIEAHDRALADGCVARDMAYATLLTQDPLDHALSTFLAQRSRRRARSRTAPGNASGAR